MKFGIHNPSWVFGPDPAEVFEAVKAKAQWAENHGFVWFSVMDHLIQIAGVGAPDEPFMEGWTVLSALAAMTSRIRLATLATSVGYRNPAHLAKIAASVDLISRGRLTLGIGAGYFETEYRQYGWGFRHARRCASDRWKRLSGSSSRCGPRNERRSTAGISMSRTRCSSRSRSKSHVHR
jgi:alkanesulfonate monooxygenase SsuD/methylene tetrahydromethanopterin reductase-like flavin-dependent oxidoreductase (luciferase family)